MRRTLRKRQKARAKRKRTGCHICKKKHPTSTTARVKRPGSTGDDTVHVCKDQVAKNRGTLAVV